MVAMCVSTRHNNNNDNFGVNDLISMCVCVFQYYALECYGHRT